MSKLTFAALRQANASRAPRWHTSEKGMNEWTIGDWFMAMAGEVGEGADELLPLMFMSFVGKLGALGNIAKKYRRVQEGIANKSNDADRLVDSRDLAIKKMFEELADVQIYLDLFALRLRETLHTEEDIGDHVEAKFNKTSELYGFPERLIDGEFCLECNVVAQIGPGFYRMIAGTLYSVDPDLKADREIGKSPLLAGPYGERATSETFKITFNESVVTIQCQNYTLGAIIAQFAMGIVEEKCICEPPLQPVDTIDRMETQIAEFDAVVELTKAYDMLTKVPIVDDDYPHYRGRYESRMMELLRRLKDNGRTLPPWK